MTNLGALGPFEGRLPFPLDAVSQHVRLLSLIVDVFEFLTHHLPHLKPDLVEILALLGQKRLYLGVCNNGLLLELLHKRCLDLVDIVTGSLLEGWDLLMLKQVPLRP